jgi:hypothetical protein
MSENGSVLKASDRINVMAIINSFQVLRKAKTDIEAITGLEIGIMILKTIPIKLKPSITAASSIARCVVSKNPIKINTLSGIRKAIFGRIKAI